MKENRLPDNLQEVNEALKEVVGFMSMINAKRTNRVKTRFLQKRLDDLRNAITNYLESSNDGGTRNNGL